METNDLPSKLSAIIVDDELFGRENLKKIIETYCHEVEILGTADSVVNAQKLVGLYNPEVVFLDINMPVLDGFDFLDEYDEKKFMVVFVSAHEEYGINAVKAGAIDYLLKPINIKELKLAIKKLLTVKTNLKLDKSFLASEKLVLPTSHGFEILFLKDIIFLEAQGCYTKVVLGGGKHKIVSKTLKLFEEAIAKHNFYRVHKSYILNIEHIKDYSNISGYTVTMSNGTRIEISRRRAPEFLQKIKSVLNLV